METMIRATDPKTGHPVVLIYSADDARNYGKGYYWEDRHNFKRSQSYRDYARALRGLRNHQSIKWGD